MIRVTFEKVDAGSWVNWLITEEQTGSRAPIGTPLQQSNREREMAVIYHRAAGRVSEAGGFWDIFKADLKVFVAG